MLWIQLVMFIFSHVISSSWKGSSLALLILKTNYVIHLYILWCRTCFIYALTAKYLIKTGDLLVRLLLVCCGKVFSSFFKQRICVVAIHCQLSVTALSFINFNFNIPIPAAYACVLASVTSKTCLAPSVQGCSPRFTTGRVGEVVAERNIRVHAYSPTRTELRRITSVMRKPVN